MHRDVARFIRSCPVCLSTKVVNRPLQAELQPLDIPTRAGQDLALDFVKLPKATTGEDTCLTVCDRFSRRVRLFATTQHITGEQTAQILIKYVLPVSGVFRSLVSDRDVRFNSDVYKHVLAALGCKLRTSTQQHPQTDGMSETSNKKVIDVLRSLTADGAAAHRDWPTWLPIVELSINTSVNEATAMSPFEVELGHNPLLPLDVAIGPLQPPPTSKNQKSAARIHQDMLDRYAIVRDTIRDHQLAMEAAQADRPLPKPFSVGDLVLVKSSHLREPGEPPSKLDVLWRGPFHVTDRVGANVAVHPLFTRKKSA
jgi:hypothetical protein